MISRRSHGVSGFDRAGWDGIFGREGGNRGDGELPEEAHHGIWDWLGQEVSHGIGRLGDGDPWAGLGWFLYGRAGRRSDLG